MLINDKLLRVVKPDTKAAAAESKPAAASKPTSGPPKKVNQKIFVLSWTRNNHA